MWYISVFSPQVNSGSDKPPSTEVKRSLITSHAGFGICVVKDKNMYNVSDDPRDGVHLELDGNKLDGNGAGEIGQVFVEPGTNDACEQ